MRAAPAAPDPELVAALVQPVSGRAESRPAEPPELPPQPPVRKTRAIVRTKPSRRLELGDLVCGTCGEGNPPTRNFCSRCGESLSDAGVVRPVWWRRLLLALRRQKKLKAGTRPGDKGTGERRRWVTNLSFRRIRTALVVVGLLIGIAYALYPPFRDTVRDNVVALYRKVSPSLEPVHPVQITTATALPDHQPQRMADAYTDTYWSSNWAPGRHPRITFRFDDTYLVRSIILYSGANDAFVDNGRPSILRLTYSNGKTENVLPQDTNRQQTLSLKNNTLINSITIEISDVFDGQSKQTVAISELEFFALK